MTKQDREMIQAPAMTAEGLREWRKARRLSQTEAGDLLGIGRRSMARYEAGEQPIPAAVRLATRGYEAGDIVLPDEPLTPDEAERRFGELHDQWARLREAELGAMALVDRKVSREGAERIERYLDLAKASHYAINRMRAFAKKYA
jgi:transcriptional regulator with XRE-family HTH domain